MTRRCLLLDYVPVGRGRAAPALAVWRGPKKTEVLGLGVRPGTEFDPLPFVGRFPDDSSEVWVFAEWAYATAAMVEEGASLPELEEWVQSDSTALVVSGTAAPTTRRTLEGIFDTEWMATRAAAHDALVFLAEETTDAAVRSAAGVRLLDPNGSTLAVLGVKRPSSGQASRWHARLGTPSSEPTTVDLGEPGAGSRIRGWLRSVV